MTAYGNLHSGMARAHYNRTFKRATLGEYSQVMVHYQYWLSTDLFIIQSIKLKHDKIWQNQRGNFLYIGFEGREDDGFDYDMLSTG